MTREEAKELLVHILMTYEPKDQYGDLDDPEPYEQAVTMAIEALSAEAVQGEWIEVEVFPEVYDIEGVKTWGSEMQCDQCGFRHTAIEGHMAQYNFCPNCGAKMKGADDED